MVSKKTAVRPDFFNNLASLKKRQEDLDKKGITDEEQAYYTMSLSKGWQQFSENAENLMSELDSINDRAVENGMSYEELGKNTVVISLVKSIIKKLLNRVEDSKEACVKQPEGAK